MCLRVYFKRHWLNIVLIIAQVAKIIIKTNKKLFFQVWRRFLLPKSNVVDSHPPVQTPLCSSLTPVSSIFSNQLAYLRRQVLHFANIALISNPFLTAVMLMFLRILNVFRATNDGCTMRPLNRSVIAKQESRMFVLLCRLGRLFTAMMTNTFNKTVKGQAIPLIIMWPTVRLKLS